MRNAGVTGVGVVFLGIAATLAGCRTLDTSKGQAVGEAAAQSQVEDQASLKDEMRLPWKAPASGRFQTAWLVCGEFPNPEAEEGEDPLTGGGFDVDYLTEHGGEAGIRPAEGMTHARPDGTIATWAVHEAATGEVDFRAVFPGRETTRHVLSYGYTAFANDVAEDATLLLGSYKSVKVWMNGELVHEHAVRRKLAKDADVVPVKLLKGVNHILVKAAQTGGGRCRVIVRVLDDCRISSAMVEGPAPRIEPPSEGDAHKLVVTVDSGTGRQLASSETVRVDVVEPGGKIRYTKQATRESTLKLDTETWPAGPYELAFTFGIGGGDPVAKHLLWYKGDRLPQIRALLEACDKIPGGGERPADLQLRMLGAALLSRLGDDPRTADAASPISTKKLGSDDVCSILLEHRELLQGPDAAKHSRGMVRLAWVDPVDDSPQFARAYLPAQYDPAIRWPLVIRLHGFNWRNPPYVDWPGTFDRHGEFGDHPVIEVHPHGRCNTGYRGIGEADVLRALQLAKEQLSVDEDRVYLVGTSMGGGGTWHVGTRHPELFAAIGPICGGWDYHVRGDKEGWEKMTPRERFRMEAGSSFAQAESLLSTPVFVHHGGIDGVVTPDNSRYAVRMLQRWGYNVRYRELSGQRHRLTGHWDGLVSWLLTHRLERNPKQVRVRAAVLESAAAHWVKVLQSDDPLRFIHVDACVDSADRITVDTDNVLQLKLSPGPGLIDPAKPVTVYWNGVNAGQHHLEDGAVTLSANGYRPAAVHKTPQVSGPIGDAATTPFAIVAGTISKDPRMRRFCMLRAQNQVDKWRAWQRVEPRFFLDTEITDEQIREYSLILYGGPADNKVTRRFIEDLPLALHPDSIEIDGARFEATDAAVGIVLPHPLNNERYVTVLAATSADGMFHAVDLPDDVDYTIVDGRIRSPESEIAGEDFRVAFGHLDYNWRFDEKLMVRGEEKARASARTAVVPRHITAKVDGKQLMLSDVLETTATGNFAAMRRDIDWQGRPIRIGGKQYENGIAVNIWSKPCEATYDLSDAGWKTLRGEIGIQVDDIAAAERECGTKLYFEVYGDGQQLYRSATFSWDNTGPEELEVDITGVKELKLLVGNDTFWHNGASTMNWADLRLEK